MTAVDSVTFSSLRYRGREESASYHGNVLKEEKGNPFLEALPRMLETKDDILEYMTVVPQFDEADRSLPDELRIRNLSVLDKFLLPNHYHTEVFRTITDMIRSGYEGRNPLQRASSLERNAVIQNAIENIYEGESDPEDINTLSSAIFGCTRVGKSKSVLHSLRYYPQVVNHSFYNGKNFTVRQLVWLHVDCPFDGRIGGLFSRILSSIDIILKTKYLKGYALNASRIDDLVRGVYTVAPIIGMGILVIDEMQVLYNLKVGIKKARTAKTTRERVATVDNLINALVSLDNTIGVPILYVGTPPARWVLGSKVRMLCRTSRLGSINWINMSYESDDWNTFVGALCSFQLVRKPVEAKIISQALYECSGGVPGIAVPVFKAAQTFAIDQGTEQLSTKSIRRVFKEKFLDYQEPIQALLSGDPVQLSLYEDFFMTLDQPIYSVHQKVVEQGGKLPSLAVPSESAAVDNKEEKLTSFQAPKRKATKKNSEHPKSEAGLSGYEALNATNRIKDSTEFLE